MPRKIIPGKTLIPQFTYQERRLPIHLPCAQYIRQSSEGQLKHNKQSSILQDQKLSERLTIMGFRQIIKIDLDTGKSGQMIKDGKLLDKKGLEQLHQLITSGSIGAVAAFSPSRLYRDLTRGFYTAFVTLLETQRIPLITFSKIYWPDNRTDMDALVQDFIAAANFIEYEVRGKLLLAKYQAIEEHVGYAGGPVPMGYVVKESEDRKFYMLYPPHAEKIRFLFRRYRELNGNLPMLGKELAAIDFAFPAFDLALLQQLGVKQPYVALKQKNGVYPCHTREALISILTNVAYIGWLVYGGAIISEAAHDAIVDRALFDYAYERLSPINLNGSENTNRPKKNSRYGKTHGLVETLLTHNGNPCYATRDGYEARERSSSWNSTTFSIPIATVDLAVTSVVLNVLYKLDQHHKKGLADDLYTQVEQLSQEKQAEGVSLTESLKHIDQAIRWWELDKQSCRETGNKQGLDEANRELAKLYQAREDVQRKAERAAQQQAALQKTLGLHERVLADWSSMPFEHQQTYLHLIVGGVTIEEVSPHVCKMVLTFKPPIEGTLTGYILRPHGEQIKWTDEEILCVKTMYPQADRADILKAVPRRDWRSIRAQAQVQGVKRETWLDTSGIPEHLSYADYTVIQEIRATCQSLTGEFGEKGSSVAWERKTLSFANNFTGTSFSTFPTALRGKASVQTTARGIL